MAIPSMRVEQYTETMPGWAILEREYLKIASQVPEILGAFLTEDGELFWPDCVKDFQTYAYGNVDNVFEGFQSIPLLYILGGDAKVLEFAKKEYAAIVRQFTTKKKIGCGIPQEQAEKLGRDTMLVDGMFPELDWMHIGESNMFLYHLLLADPSDEHTKAALEKLAVYCLGENPAGFESNYDPEHKVFRSGYLGANGPAYERFKQPYVLSRWMDYYGLPFYDVEGVHTYLDLAKEECAVAMGKVYEERLAHCDTITSLFSTSLAVNAYMVTGDTKYRDFVLDYVGAWRKRGEGLDFIPDNAGPNGIVGETLGGRFYGSHYGYTLPHGHYFIEDALIVGGQNERFFTGRKDSLDWARELFDTLIERYGIAHPDGGVRIPLKRADEGSEIEYVGRSTAPHASKELKFDQDPRHVHYEQVDGWYEFGFPNAPQWGHIYAASHSRKDAERMEEVLPQIRFKVSEKNISAKYKGGQHAAYMRYLEGKYPEFPEEIMNHSIRIFNQQVAFLEEEKAGKVGDFGYEPDNEYEWKILEDMTEEICKKTGFQFDKTVVHSYYQDFLLYRNPLSMEGMLNLAMGAMAPVYNGGLIHAQLRYFDPEEKRPGLPAGVAALVSSITEEGITLTLANTDVLSAHTVILQGGVYGEHRICNITFGGEVHAIDSKWAKVTVGASSVAELKITMKRHVNEPTLEEPLQYI